jgi:hypothetical protein
VLTPFCPPLTTQKPNTTPHTAALHTDGVVAFRQNAAHQPHEVSSVACDQKVPRRGRQSKLIARSLVHFFGKMSAASPFVLFLFGLIASLFLVVTQNKHLQEEEEWMQPFVALMLK